MVSCFDCWQQKRESKYASPIHRRIAKKCIEKSEQLYIKTRRVKGDYVHSKENCNESKNHWKKSKRTKGK